MKKILIILLTLIIAITVYSEYQIGVSDRFSTECNLLLGTIPPGTIFKTINCNEYTTMPDEWRQINSYFYPVVRDTVSGEYIIQPTSWSNALEQFNTRLLTATPELTQVYISFFALCDVLGFTNSTPGFADLRAKLYSMKETDPLGAMLMSIDLLAIDAEGKRLGGLQWWDNAVRIEQE